MSDSNIVIRKKRGRPRTGQTPVVSLQLEPEWQQDIDEWRHGEPDQLSRSEAIRMLLGMGLSAAYEERKADSYVEKRLDAVLADWTPHCPSLLRTRAISRIEASASCGIGSGGGHSSWLEVPLLSYSPA